MTWAAVNERLDAQAAARIQRAVPEGEFLSGQMERLNREWDFERVLESEASGFGLLGLLLGVAVRKSLLFVPGFVAAMILLHATQGCYPGFAARKRSTVNSMR